MKHDLVESIWRDLAFYGVFKEDILMTKKRPIVAAPKKRIVKKSIGKVLESLDETFSMMKKIRPSRSHLAEIARKHGAVVLNSIPNDAGFSINRITGHKVYGFPSVLTLFNDATQNDDSVAAFTVLVKQKSTDNDVIYQGSFVTHHDGSYFECEMSVSVDPITSKVRALPVLHQSFISYPTRLFNRKNGNKFSSRYSNSHLAANRYCIPDLRGDDQMLKYTKSQFIEERFCAAFNLAMMREMYTNIIASNKDGKAVFFVEDIAMKDFFKDRISVTENGRTKRIFHPVASHYRDTKAGDTTVKTHYRGLREFNWNSYKINIRIPGKHQHQNALFQAPAASYRAKGRMVGPSQVFRVIQAEIPQQ